MEHKKSEELKINTKDAMLQWRQIRPKDQISRRSYCTGCIYQQKLYIYGGVDIGEGTEGNLSSIAIYQVMPTWTQEIKHAAGMPASISRHAASLVTNTWYISGGEYQSDSSNAIFSINLDTLKATAYTLKGDTLPKIDSHTMNYLGEGSNKTLVLIGGFQNNSKSNNVFALDISNGSCLSCKNVKASGTAPIARSNHSTIVYKSVIYLFGGITEEGAHLNDLWKWTSGTWEEIKSVNPPISRGCHSALEYNGAMYIFGGQEQIGRERNDIFKYSIAENKWGEVFQNSEQPKIELSLPSPTKSSELKQTFSPTSTLKLNMPINHSIFNMLQDHTLFNISPKHTIHSRQSQSPPKNDMSPNKTMYANNDPFKSLTYRNTGIEFFSMKQKNNQPDANRNSSFKTMSIPSDISITKEVSKQESKLKVYDRVVEPIYGIVEGKYPCYRDGHTACLLDNQMVIFGGDRNKVSFNDLFLFNLNENN
jgi:N-acetylneuraminic acid mutarotase